MRTLVSRPGPLLTDSDITGTGMTPSHHPGGLIEMAKHADKSTGNGQGDFGLSKIKNMREAGGGKHSSEDRVDQDDQGYENDEDGGKE
jgi:hypothetical protein